MREKWIEMRKSNSWDLMWFWEEYIKMFDPSKHKIFVPFELFKAIFPQYLQNNIRDIISYFDQKFELTVIEVEDKVIYIN